MLAFKVLFKWNLSLFGRLFSEDFHPLGLYQKEFLCFCEFLSWALLGLIRFYFCAEKRWIPAMNYDPDIKAHKSFANEHSFDVWFLFQIWNTHSFWFWTTNDPPWSAYYSGKGISTNNPLNERIFNEIATMIAQKRTRKCTRKCRHFRCLRENNKRFEEPDGHNKYNLFITTNSTPCTQHVLTRTVAKVLYAEAFKFFKR